MASCRWRWATHSRRPPIIQAARALRHEPVMRRSCVSRISNGVLEAINGLVQAARARAPGYRDVRNIITMVYLIVGRLDFRHPHETAKKQVT